MKAGSRILLYILANPGRSTSQIARASGCSSATLSSWLRKMVNAGALVREPGLGPRKGFGYFATCRSHEDCCACADVGRECLLETVARAQTRLRAS